MNYRVLIRRNADGVERLAGPYKEYDGDPGLAVFSWRHNNFSCDCNRHLEFERAGGASEDDIWEDVECGEGRYDVLRFEREDGAALDEDRCVWVAKQGA